MLYYTLFLTADTLTVNTNQNVTAPRQLWYVVYLHNFMIAQ